MSLRDFECPIADCNKRFKLKHHLNKHIKTHFKDSNINCEQKTIKEQDGKMITNGDENRYTLKGHEKTEECLPNN